ncbi:hypothetical protein FHS27_005096 [Rhodopirellula rubra]|uniref:Uncharacterized protein n=1 Tax=Aporhodopirellula rubra TaxID=980271 RepID=A0A7W5H8Q6_9BACT|nr:hypothetical protein [Aporhodopirellula rubra]
MDVDEPPSSLRPPKRRSVKVSAGECSPLLIHIERPFLFGCNTNSSLRIGVWAKVACLGWLAHRKNLLSEVAFFTKGYSGDGSLPA